MNASSKGLRLVRIAVVVATVVVIAVMLTTVDLEALGLAADRAADRPPQVAMAIGAFAVAFVLRAVAWRRVLPSLPLGHALAGIHVALGANHALPLRMGEPMRVVSVTRRAGVPVDVATASTITLRAADVLTMVVLGAVVAPSAFIDLVGPLGWALLAVVVTVAVVGRRWLSAVARRRADVRLPGPSVVALSAAAWLFEAVLVRFAAQWAGLHISWPQALLVTTVAVAAQVAAVAPGGFGTYEAAAVAAYVALGFDPEPALVAALGAHAVKTVYSLLAGLVAVAIPAPAMFGRLRLDRSAPSPDREPVEADAAGSVLLFLPAFNEEATIGRCVRRAPAAVFGRPVEVVVIDDGSTDGTAECARRAGAEVISVGQNRGLGAAVRLGLELGAARRSVAVAFCDADGEYAPEELDTLVGPIVAGRADYVVGSRFDGHIHRMRPHRRLGNRLLSRMMSIIARRPISDGQSGYRAFSGTAAASAEVIHDFNYAQVLTLDLLAKGYRYEEVPISYRFRTEGESFIRLGPYLRNVIPAVYREVNTAPR